MTTELPALYPIVNICGTTSDEIANKAQLARQLAAAGASLIQLRAKDLPAGSLAELAGSLVNTLRAKRCKLIINDRADIAAATKAAGVHLGDEDLPAPAARQLLGPDAIIGVSTHSAADVASVAEGSVSYIGFGPVFESPTKAGVREARGLDLLHRVCATSGLPVVAIGGIESARAGAVFSAGSASCAVISELERAQAPADLIAIYQGIRARAQTEA